MIFSDSRFPESNPSDLLSRRDGIYASDLLITAIAKLNIFNWLAANPADLHGVCTRLGIAERPADVMLTLFVAMRLLNRMNGRYTLTEKSREFLSCESPWDLTPYFASLEERPICQEIFRVLREDRPFSWGNRLGEEEWAKAMEREDFAATFTAAMDSRGAYLAPAMARVLQCEGRTRLLDIAGASGIYACAVVAEHPHLQAAVFEKPPVDRVARAAIAKYGFSDRVSVIAGDMFAQALPTGFDLHLYSNVLHDWNENDARHLLDKSFIALPPGGTVVIHDVHLSRDKSGPIEMAEYSVLLMLSSQGKCYSEAEMEAMLQSAGFINVTYAPTVAFRSVIFAERPRR
jgi:hypothetical protein